MIKYKIVNSPTQPGPDYIKVTPEILEWIKWNQENELHWIENRIIIENMIKEAEEELTTRRSLGEDI